MKPVVTRLYAVLVVLTLVALAAWSGADWYQHQQEAQAQGLSVLRQAAGRISNLSIQQGASTVADVATVFRGPSTDSRWKVLLLQSSERGTEYYRGPRPAVPVSQAVPRWEPQAWTEVKVVLPVFLAVGPPLTLEGIYEFYGRSEIFGLLKACGMTLLGLLVLTILMVFLSGQTPEPSSNGVSDPAPAREAPDPEAFDFSSLPDEEPLGPVAETPDEEYWFDDGTTLDDLPPLDAPTDLGPPTQGDPSLSSPKTGLGWESSLGPRLEAEVTRSAGMNQDLALVLLEPRGTPGDPRAWGQAIRDAFPSVDLGFESGEGAAVILPGRSLESALTAARAFVDEAERRWGLTVHAGVAARSGRHLSGQTLRDEAGSALRRSLAGTVRVLGLKTDPDRWRDHLSRPA